MRWLRILIGVQFWAGASTFFGHGSADEAVHRGEPFPFRERMSGGGLADYRMSAQGSSDFKLGILVHARGRDHLDRVRPSRNGSDNFEPIHARQGQVDHGEVDVRM